MATVKPKSKVATAKVAKKVPRKTFLDYSLIEQCLVVITGIQVVQLVLGCLA